MEFCVVCSAWYVIHHGKIEEFKQFERCFLDLDAAKEFARSIKDEDPYKTVFVAKVIDELAF